MDDLKVIYRCTIFFGPFVWILGVPVYGETYDSYTELVRSAFSVLLNGEFF